MFIAPPPSRASLKLRRSGTPRPCPPALTRCPLPQPDPPKPEIGFHAKEDALRYRVDRRPRCREAREGGAS